MENNVNSANNLDKNTKNSQNKFSHLVSNTKNNIKRVFSKVKIGLAKQSYKIDLIKYSINPEKKHEDMKDSYLIITMLATDILKVLSKETELFDAISKTHDNSYANTFIKKWKDSIEWIHGSTFYLEKTFQEYQKDPNSAESETKFTNQVVKTLEYISNYLDLVKSYADIVGKDAFTVATKS